MGGTEGHIRKSNRHQGLCARGGGKANQCRNCWSERALGGYLQVSMQSEHQVFGAKDQGPWGETGSPVGGGCAVKKR